ncbi:MAG TPA: dUTP diphosphatase [Candidatus Polarisedimenticolia bacterium]|nr:dUTP diphosphatase [Candidatus Polarisedimenticolia bacterium]
MRRVEDEAAGPNGGRVAVPIARSPENEDLPLPEPATAGSAGLDLRACVAEPVVLAPGRRALIPTGFSIALPPGYEGQIRPRSGLALRQGLTLLNSPGTIDSDYRGEVAVVAVNLGQEPVTISRGDRIAQLVIAPVARVRLLPTGKLPPTGRGGGGFGHTGTS